MNIGLVPVENVFVIGQNAQIHGGRKGKEGCPTCRT